MGVAKRLYLYLVAAISLFVFATGAYNLVAVVLGEISDALGASVIGSSAAGREQVSLAIALVVVGGPVFAIHWWLVSRSWRGTDQAAMEDRRSAIRAFHLGLVATIALAVSTFAALQIVDGTLRTVLGATETDGGRASDDWAMLLVATPVWWYHWRRRAADIRHDVLMGSAAWLTRLHRYVWAFAGIMLLVVGASQVLETVASVLIGRSGFGADERWWVGPLCWSIALIVVGLGVFAFHAADARHTISDAAVIGTDDRATAIRASYFAAVMLVAVVVVAMAGASSIAELLRLAMGVADDVSLEGLLERVVGPVIVAIPYVVAGWLHRDAQRHEAAALGTGRVIAADRLTLHLAAAVGLAFLAVGAARLIGRILESAVGSVGAGEFFRYEIAWFIGQALIGAILWIPAWTLVLRRRAADPLAERHAAVSRAYLYLVVGVSLVAAVPSAAFTLYRLIDTLLGGRGVRLGEELALPIAAVIVAGLVAWYHGRLVVSDLRAAAPASVVATAIPGEPPTVLVTEAVPGPAVASLALILRGPRGSDLPAIVGDLRTHLPPGVSLQDG
jgi:hypothetical protein